MKRLLLLVLVAWVLSCASDEAIRCRFDDDVSEHDRTIISKAMSETWNPVSTRPIIFAPDGDERISVVDQILDRGAVVDGRECTYAGRDCDQGQWIRIRKGMPSEQLFVTAAHEAGHALGLTHIDEPGVMFPGAPEAKLTAADITECQRVEACGMILISRADDSARTP